MDNFPSTIIVGYPDVYMSDGIGGRHIITSGIKTNNRVEQKVIEKF